jgi:membrane protease YdiL (CAAX protease family)
MTRAECVFLVLKHLSRSKGIQPQRISHMEESNNSARTFTGGIRTVVGFAVAFAVVTAVWVPLTAAVSDAPAWIGLLSEIGKFAVIAGAVWVLLRLDGVGISELGLSRGHLGSAAAAFGAVWLALNVWGVGIATATGNRWDIALIWYLPDIVTEQYGSLPAPWLIFVLLNFLIVGLVEEVAFRGYFQSKMIALLGDETRRHVALGILATSLVFGALHTPGALVSGAGPGGALTAAMLPAITAVLFGIIYELTHNVYLVAMFHGLGNTWPLVIDWPSWSGTALLGFWVGAGAIYVAAIVGYRYWAAGTDSPHRVGRTEAGQSGLLE